LNNFGLVVHKKNQGLSQKINSKGKIMIKHTQKSSRNSGIRRSLTQGRNQIKRRICQKYNVSTVEKEEVVVFRAYRRTHGPKR
jgi:hypothetical protein